MRVCMAGQAVELINKDDSEILLTGSTLESDGIFSCFSADATSGSGSLFS